MAATSFWVAKLIMAVFALGVFFLHQISFPRKPLHFIEEIFTLLAAFFALYVLWAWVFFFTPLWWVVILLTMVIFFPIFFQAFYKMGNVSRLALLNTLVATLIIGETTWAILFTPVYFLTASVMIFSVFYLIYMLGNLHYEGRLNKKKLIFQTSLILTVFILTLLSSPWQPTK